MTRTYLTPSWIAADAAAWWVERNAAGRGFPQPLTIECTLGVGTYSDKECVAERPITLVISGLSATMDIEDAQVLICAAVDKALIVRGQDFTTQIKRRTLAQQIEATENALSECRLEDCTALLNQLVIMRSLAALQAHEKTAP